MKHLGDITKINGTEIEPVNCIIFGSPCQDLSIAGKRAGLAGERSGLFMEAVRIIKEMREKTNGEQPRYAVWENVPGAFSSNHGEDFRAVLEELVRTRQQNITIPRPKNGKWGKAGTILGDGWSIAWRQFDAQYWGVPQRRKRIGLVFDLDGNTAGDIIFECIRSAEQSNVYQAELGSGVECGQEVYAVDQSLFGNPPQSIYPWKGIARNPADSAGGASTGGGQ